MTSYVDTGAVVRLVRRDSIHKAVVAAYRRAGVLFLDTSHHGGFGCDIVAAHIRTGEVKFVELKNGDLPPSRRKLTPSEERLKALFPDSFVVALSVEEALSCVGISVLPLTADRVRRML